MNPPVFESSFISLTLAWVFAIPTLLGVIAMGGSIFIKHEGFPWVLSLWIGICVIILSPARYILFLLISASSFPFQSFGAFIDTFILALYIPIIYGILSMMAFLPFAAIYKLFSNNITALKSVLIAVLIPISCVISSAIFFFLLPCAGMTLGWVKAKDIIKATNGPAAFYFKYVVAPYAPILLPDFYQQTPKQDIDMLRCHVAEVFLSDKRKIYFLKNQYPDIYNTITE